jgi:hypothetical protein
VGIAGSSPGVKRPECEADHSLTRNLQVKIRGALPLLPQYVFKVWRLVKKWVRPCSVVLSEVRGKLHFYLIIAASLSVPSPHGGGGASTAAGWRVIEI